MMASSMFVIRQRIFIGRALAELRSIRRVCIFTMPTEDRTMRMAMVLAGLVQFRILHLIKEPATDVNHT
jgi:hypothetical protein